MEAKKIIIALENCPGNFSRHPNDIYITLSNMLVLPNLVKNSGRLHSFLITPYLVNQDTHTFFELHYYEFEIEVGEWEKSYYVDYPKRNLLPNEIIDNFKPKAFVTQNDFTFYEKALNDYFKNIKKSSFAEEKKFNSDLKTSKLYFQIF